MMWRSDDLRGWLDPQRSVNGRYRHLMLVEVADERERGLSELAQLAREAHRDARERLERLLEVSLDPLDEGARRNPNIEVYPDALDTITLQGYLGEVFAGLVAENYEPHSTSWVVPAFLFRNHVAGVQALERRRQLGEPARGPGRTGDDAVAFVVDSTGVVTAWLYGEAKCTHDHNRQLINHGHEQLSTELYLPVDLTQLIEILGSRGDAESAAWADALRLLFFTPRSAAPPRFDMLVYVCGRRPVQTPSRLSPDTPAPEYTGGRELEAVEIHLDDFDDILTTVYPAHTIAR